MFDAQNFQETLRQARLRAGLSQRQLAQGLYVSTQAVSKWERGESVPDLAHISALAELLHISADALLAVGSGLPPALIGVDAGGTKTELVLVTGEGQLLQRLVLPGANPNTCTVEACAALLQQGIDTLLLTPCRLQAVFVGGAGMSSGENGQRVQALLRRRYPGVKLRCRTDICNILAFAGDPDNAIAAICGTGSVVYAAKEGQLTRFGGGGWRLETLGSGYDLGRGALLAALEHRDGTGPATAITEGVEQQLGGCVWEHIPQIYSGEPSFLASFAPIVLQAWQRGDGVATALVEANCRRLAQLIGCAARHSPGAKEVILGGSVLTGSQAFRGLLSDMLQGLRTRAVSLPPVWGAVLCCARMVDAPVEEAQFLPGYEKEVN